MHSREGSQCGEILWCLFITTRKNMPSDGVLLARKPVYSYEGEYLFWLGYVFQMCDWCYKRYQCAAQLESSYSSQRHKGMVPLMSATVLTVAQ